MTQVDAAAVPVHRVRVPALERQIDCREDETLFAAARRAGLRLVGACGGRGTCGSCVVRVQHGHVQQQDSPDDVPWQRACRLQPRSALTIEIAPRSLAAIARADVHSGGSAELPGPPLFGSATVQLAPATLEDPTSDSERLRRALVERPDAPAQATFDADTLTGLPGLLRAHGGRVDVRWQGQRIIGFAAPGAALLGLAVDLGTTNAAAFIVDLARRRRLASLGLENPQVAWGADLVSRLDHASRDAAAARELQQAAVDVINALAHDLSREVGADPGDIAALVVCGNTAMQHLLAGLPVAQLARAPFVAATLEALDLPARSLGLHLGAGAALHLAPQIGGYVGGDHVAALLATEALWSAPGPCLVIDIGTNSEISLVHSGRIWSASCPSGPALEGGHIGCGMRAAEGAVERMAPAAGGGWRLKVIGNTPPLGLCGSGVLDAMASFVHAGAVNARGRIVGHGSAGHQRWIELAAATADAPALRFHQADVRAVQLAKSAIRTGVQMLCREAGLDEAAIERCVIAGAFGAYLDVASALAIGLFPPLPRERFVQVGNAAGLGAQQMLASGERRARAAALARGCRHVELSTRPGFQKTFLRNLALQEP